MAKPKKAAKQKAAAKKKPAAKPRREPARSAAAKESTPVEYSDLRKVMLASVLKRLR